MANGFSADISAGVSRTENLDMFSALVAGLCDQQAANDPGGDRLGKPIVCAQWNVLDARRACRWFERRASVAARVRTPSKRVNTGAAHDGRTLADVFAEWAETHGEPFTL